MPPPVSAFIKLTSKVEWTECLATLFLGKKNRENSEGVFCDGTGWCLSEGKGLQQGPRIWAL